MPTCPSPRRAHPRRSRGCPGPPQRSCAVRWYDAIWHEVKWSNAVGCEVMWGESMWLVATCHVMSCDVMSSGVMWCGVTWCDDVMWCDLMQWAGILCGCGVKWLGVSKNGYRELMSQWYNSILKKQKYNSVPQCNYIIDETATFMFDSRNTWNVQYREGSNLWDAKRGVSTAFTSGSGNTWNVQCIARNNL